MNSQKCKRKRDLSSMSYTIADVDRMNIQDIIAYIRWQLPGRHFKASDAQLRLLTIQLLDQDGLLNQNDSRILHTPYFGRLLIASHNDPFEAEVHFLTDVLPGASLFMLFGHLL